MSRPNKLTNLSNKEAYDFLIKETSYINFNLPKYFTFGKLLQNLSKRFSADNFDYNSYIKHGEEPKHISGVNYKIVHNKDGQYSWRELQIIHPFIYLSLVKLITQKENWELIQKKFKEYSSDKRISCTSIPLVATDKRKDKSVQILGWWEKNEKESIKQLINYKYILQTDITDCYPSIYTHSICWALHGKENCKSKLKGKTDTIDTSLGDEIDRLIGAMQQGQTNGIPQGSTLMDFIAEFVLGYADCEISKKLDEFGFENLKILRYRDDYKVYTNSLDEGKSVLKIITEVLLDLGLKISKDKTTVSDDIVTNSIKKEKLYWLTTHNHIWASIYTDNSDIIMRTQNIARRIQSIREFAKTYPNSGQVNKQLNLIDSVINEENIRCDYELCIALLVDIALRSPTSYDIVASLLSKFLCKIPSYRKKELIRNIWAKFDQIPNTHMLDIWLQRIALKIELKKEVSSPLCKIAEGEDENIWNSEWINSDEIKKIINSRNNLFDKSILKDMKCAIDSSEVNIFDY